MPRSASAGTVIRAQDLGPRLECSAQTEASAFFHPRSATVRFTASGLPKKRATYLRMVETLLKAGAPLGGLGNQSHLFADLAPGAITAAITDLASMGLPIHVSELDISLNWSKALFASRDDLVQRQARLAGEIGEAFARLKPSQRFAFTTWGLRDRDSWLRSAKENPSPPWDAPLLFDDLGNPKTTFWAVADAWRGRR